MKNATLLRYHSWLGLIAGSFLVVIGLSGAILAFNEDIDRALFSRYDVEVSSQTRDIDHAVKTIQNTYPGWEARLIHFSKGETLIFNLRRPDARRYVFIHPQNGAVIADINAHTQFVKWLLTLHYSLHAGLPGKMLIFLVGVLFLLSLITGIILYRKVILKTLLFKVKLKRNAKRSFYWALHGYVGVWALLLNLLLVFTGILLSWTVTKAALQPAASLNPPKISASIEKALSTIKREHPDFSATYIRLPKQESASITVNGVFRNDPFYLSEYYNKIQVDYRTGEITGVIKIQDGSAGSKFNSMISPLHYGQFGGFWSKLLYCFIGLSGPLLSVTGFVLWKRRSRFQKSRALERSYSQE